MFLSRESCSWRFLRLMSLLAGREAETFCCSGSTRKDPGGGLGVFFYFDFYQFLRNAGSERRGVLLHSVARYPGWLVSSPPFLAGPGRCFAGAAPQEGMRTAVHDYEQQQQQYIASMTGTGCVIPRPRHRS